MAKNLRPGPNWIQAVVVERLGPLSYFVETRDNNFGNVTLTCSSQVLIMVSLHQSLHLKVITVGHRL